MLLLTLSELFFSTVLVRTYLTKDLLVSLSDSNGEYLGHDSLLEEHTPLRVKEGGTEGGEREINISRERERER